MSTRSLIGYYDGAHDDVVFSYCHYDGYPDGVGKTLVEYYNIPELARKVASLHGFSSLAETYEETKSQEYDDDFCYGRMPYDEYRKTDKFGVDYVYIYKDRHWSVRPTFGYNMGTIIEENLLEAF